jgi:putative transcriptional regulator
LKLGNYLRKYRFEKGQLTQQELANAVGVTRLTIHSIENEKFTPSTLLAIKLANFFQVPVEEIFFITEEQRKK